MKRGELMPFLEDARKAGYTVVKLNGGNSGYQVFKRRKNDPQQVKIGLWLTWGVRGLSAVRMDVDLSVAGSIRRTADMRKLLGIVEVST